MHRYRLLVVCAFLLYAWFPLPAQTQKWTEYASASSVRAIAAEGRYLWLATQTEGLVKFDTQTLTGTQYTAINSQLPTLQYISSIAVDNNRVKWIATPRGLVRYDDTNWNLYNTSNTPLTSSNILTVATGADNSVWVSTLNEIACFSNGGWKLYTPKDFSCLKNITSLYVSPNGDVWLGRYYAQQQCRSAYVLRNGELLSVSDDFNNREITDITGSANTLWFATNARQIVGGTTRYVSALISHNGTEFKTYLWNDIGFTEPTTFTSVAVDKTAGVWVLAPDGESAGAAHFDGKTWTMFNSTNSPLQQSMILNSLATDETGTLWVATNQGLLRYDGTQWREISRLGLANPPLHHISTFAIDAQRNIWGCYDPYLAPELADSCVYYTAQGWQHQSLPADSIKQMVIDREGNRWIQRLTGAIYRFRNNTWQQMRRDGIYGDIYINKKNEVWTTGIQKLDGDTWTDTPSDVSTWGDGIAVSEDRHGTMWFATYRGLVSYDGTSWKHYPRDPSEMPDAGTGMIVMTCDSADNIWLGSNNYVGLPTKGLHRFANGTWHTHVGPIDSVGRVTALTTDCRGNVWVSSSKLFRFDGSEWTEYGIANSPVASAPSQLLVDADNTVWMSISTGILAYRQEAPVSVHETRSTNTATAVLAQNYPNPAATITSIGYELPEAGGQQKVKLTVWSALGRAVATLVHEVQTPGFYTVRYDTGVLPPGVYYYRLETGGSTLSRQMIVVR